MIKYEVGKQFPHAKYLGKGEITVAMLNTAFFDVVCALGNISQSEKKDWKNGKLTVFLYENEDIPFIVFAFDNWNFDVNININKVKADEMDCWLNSEANIINLFLVEATTGNLEAMRMISIPANMAERIRDICERQSGSNDRDVNNKMNSILELVTTQTMISKSIQKFKIK